MFRTCVLRCYKVAQIDIVQNYIKSLIKNHGPISVHTYMREVLTQSNYGYYMSKDVFGTQGDFVTSPELSQMFGELWGIWIYNEWVNQGKFDLLQLVEFGPGRGSLMQDILRTLAKFPEILSNITSVNFVEVSPKLREIQETNISKTLNQLNLNVNLNWWDSINDLPKGEPSVFLAHEFFDALPIYKFKKNESNVISEVLIDVDGDNLKFVYANRQTKPLTAFKLILDRYSNFEDIELSPESASLCVEIARRIGNDGGLALICDYGHCGEKQDTFRAFKNHQVTDPLKDVGESDLTADVNFKFLLDEIETKQSEKVVTFGPVTQQTFLYNMGINLRLSMLLKNSKSAEVTKYLISGYNMLMDPKEMGDRFKFVAILPRFPYTHNKQYLPSGF